MKMNDHNVYGSGLALGDWCALRDVVFPFLHVEDPKTVPMPEAPAHLRNHPVVEAIRRYKAEGKDEDLDTAGRGLIPVDEPFGWYVALTK